MDFIEKGRDDEEYELFHKMILYGFIKSKA